MYQLTKHILMNFSDNISTQLRIFNSWEIYNDKIAIKKQIKAFLNIMVRAYPKKQSIFGELII